MSVLGSIASRPRLWRSRRTQRIVVQAAFAAGVLLVLAYLFSRARELDLDFAFMRSPAGFAISNDWVYTYDSSESRFAAYLVGSGTPSGSSSSASLSRRSSGSWPALPGPRTTG